MYRRVRYTFSHGHLVHTSLIEALTSSHSVAIHPRTAQLPRTFLVETQPKSLVIEKFLLPDIVFTTGSRGAAIISVGGYKFLKQRTTNCKTRWWCGTNVHKGCTAVLFTIGDEIVKIRNEHNHPPPQRL
ncbi:unnamed protein product [Arctia plantaginis]|uniref:FLYWCH-type domain-containing protein n=1 Tax=Arctia plantaginis TaxID=874455 RepID=A0A8S1AVE7_ARCPL|nr:unnamed protein product [Arctia plantaginis]